MNEKFRPRKWRLLVVFNAFALLISMRVAAQNPTQGPALAAPQAPAARVTLDRAVDLALQHNHSLQATRNLILQNQAQEITANLRPNPVALVDEQYMPFFSPSAFNREYINQSAVYDLGFSYLFERGRKRQHRLEAARDQTATTTATVTDNERILTAGVAQQFIGALLAKANLELAQRNLASFQQTVDVGDASFKAGAMSEADLLKIKLQMLQFETDLSAAKLARVQSLAGLRQLIGEGQTPGELQRLDPPAFAKLQSADPSIGRARALALPP